MRLVDRVRESIVAQVLALLVVLTFALLAYLRDAGVDHAKSATCMKLYEAAQSIGDTSVVDRIVPLPREGYVWARFTIRHCADYRSSIQPISADSAGR